MLILRKSLLLICLALLFIACGKKKKQVSLAGEDPVAITDFIDFFPTVALPVQLNDSILKKKEADSLLISHKIFVQFVPDSILTKTFGKTSNIKLYPLGKVPGNASENYLFVKAVTASKRQAFILVFDRKQQFIASLAGFRLNQPATVSQTLVMDRKYAVTNAVLRKNADGNLSEGKEVYVLNADANVFTLILTEALEDKATELINPIDTFDRKHKYSADYGPGKMNLVSVRDGRKPDRMSFFIHFEKNNATCIGELKGEAIWRTATTAEYKVDGDPCIIKFNFTSSTVTLKETSCGSRRGLKCLFDGSYVKRKEVKPKKTGKSSGTKKI